MPQILKDTRDLCRSMALHRPVCGERIVRLDVKDFFMSGRPDELCTDVCDLFDSGVERTLVYDALCVLLNNQYIVNPYTADQQNNLFKVILGSGMGLPQSGAIADGAFCTRCEVPFLQSLAWRGIRWWYRFKDDVIFSAESFPVAQRFVHDIRQVARYFKIEVESVSQSRAQFLNVELVIENGRYVTHPFFKPTSLQRPLGEDSAHPWKVHTSWPASCARSYFEISSCRVDAMHARSVLLNRLKKFHASEEIINSMLLSDTNSKRYVKHAPSSKTVWLVVPFHPACANAIRKELKFLSSDQELHRLICMALGSHVQLRISWCNCLPAISSVIASEGRHALCCGW